MSSNRVSSFVERLNELFRNSGRSAASIAEDLSVSKQTVSAWLNGTRSPKRPVIETIARYFSVDIAWLMGFDVPMKGSDIKSWRDQILPIRRKKVRLLGTIAAGAPIYADEDHESYVLADDDVKCDFALRACGDSMVNAQIHDGDVVFIREQPDVNDGDIAAVIIDDSATLKRVYKKRDGVMLVSENPKFAPMYYTSENSDIVRILGKAVAVQHTL